MHGGVHTIILLKFSHASASFLFCRQTSGDKVAERADGMVQNMVVMELCEGGSLLKVLQKDDGRRRPREFGWCAAPALTWMCTLSLRPKPTVQRALLVLMHIAVVRVCLIMQP